jgi:hypothetical protein
MAARQTETHVLDDVLHSVAWIMIWAGQAKKDLELAVQVDGCHEPDRQPRSKPAVHTPEKDGQKQHVREQLPHFVEEQHQ